MGERAILKEGTTIAILSLGTLATISEDAIKNSTNSDAFSHYDMCVL